MSRAYRRERTSMTLREYHRSQLDLDAYIYLYDHMGNRIGTYNSYYYYPESHEKALLKYYGDCIVIDATEKNDLGDIAITILKDKPKVVEESAEVSCPPN